MTQAAVAEHAVGGEGALALTASAIAELVAGELIGDPDRLVRGVAPLDRAGPDQLSFVTGPRYAAALAGSRAGVVLTPVEMAGAASGADCRILVASPHEALLAVLAATRPEAPRVVGVHPSAVIGTGASIGGGVSIGANVVIGDGASIADDVTLHPNVTVGTGATVGTGSVLHPGVSLYAGARIGSRVILHAGARIGCDGFGYVQRNARHEKIPHIGGCIVEDDVEIGANSTIDRGSIDDTVIGAGTKIDNLVHIGHNVRIGRGCLIMAQVGIAGSAHIEDYVVLAGQAGVGGHVTIGAQARIGGQAGVFGSVPPKQEWSGYPARPHRQSLRAQAALLKLPALLRRIESLLDREDRPERP